MTTRPDKLKAATLANIKEKTGWSPQHAFFNEWGLKAPEAKQRMLKDYVFPKFGDDNAKYLAIESNDDTARMYADNGIERVKQENSRLS